MNFNPHEQDSETQIAMAEARKTMLKTNKITVFDIEIIKAIPDRNQENDPTIKYCGGWQDHAGMGISVIGAYSYADDRYRVFLKDNFGLFEDLLHESDIVVSFNGLAFDNRVLEACGINPPDATTYDLLVETWAAAGLAPKFNYKTHGGFGLDAVCSANFDLNKTGHGALAPVQWQQGKYGHVIDYCLEDVRLTKKLFDLATAGPIKNPKSAIGGSYLMLRDPFIVK